MGAGLGRGGGGREDGIEEGSNTTEKLMSAE